MDPKRADGTLALPVQVLQRAADLAKCRSKLIEQSNARIRQRYAARRAIEEAHAESPLQSAHRLAERRRRDPQPRSRSAEAAQFGDLYERRQGGHFFRKHR